MTRLLCVTWCMVVILTSLTVRYWSEQDASDSRTVLPSSLLTTQHLGRSAFWLSRHRFHSVDSANLQHHQHPSATLVMLACSQSRHQMKTFQRQVIRVIRECVTLYQTRRERRGGGLYHTKYSTAHYGSSAVQSEQIIGETRQRSGEATTVQAKATTAKRSEKF